MIQRKRAQDIFAGDNLGEKEKEKQKKEIDVALFVS